MPTENYSDASSGSNQDEITHAPEFNGGESDESIQRPGDEPYESDDEKADDDTLSARYNELRLQEARKNPNATPRQIADAVYNRVKPLAEKKPTDRGLINLRQYAQCLAVTVETQDVGDAILAAGCVFPYPYMAAKFVAHALKDLGYPQVEMIMRTDHHPTSEATWSDVGAYGNGAIDGLRERISSPSYHDYKEHANDRDEYKRELPRVP